MITLYRIFLVLMGVVAGLMLPEVLSLPQDSQYTIGPGFLPMIMLGLVIACCVILLIFDLIHKDAATVKKESIPHLLLYVAATILLVVGMEHVGIILSVVVYIFAVSFFVEKHKLVESILVAVLTGTFIYLIFHVWLKVPMTICNFL